jgi:hypothetical protein
MSPKKPEKICAACGCKDTKNIPFTDGKSIKWITACSHCETINDDRVVEVYYEPYTKKGNLYPVSLISDTLTSLF